jgi:hypothetical protein
MRQVRALVSLDVDDSDCEVSSIYVQRVGCVYPLGRGRGQRPHTPATRSTRHAAPCPDAESDPQT